VLRHKAAGRLPSTKLVFPNVELRLDVATAKGGFVNLHLFVSPEDPQHIDELRRLLSRLQFNVMQDRFDCTRADLIRLGKKADPNITDERAALAYGANQFKVNFQKLREVFSESGWAKKNILIAVARGATDGTSGEREAADQTIRREIEGFAHVIFAGSPAQREFWLGQKDLVPHEMRARYGGLKPCLHGSDAHKLDDVASPFGNRVSWIKGGLEFDALRQACIDPEGRAYVGEQPPGSAMPSQVISHVQIGDADWAATADIPLNHGLVAIIGARGSGKTALADVIAAGCDAISPSGWNADENISPSFLARARRLIGDASTTLTWGGGATVTRALDGGDANGHMTFPRARYLSQQFVEELCSAKGVSDGLVDEIERVIFESHSQDDREWALDFAELRDQQTSRFRQAREREAEAIADISDRIAIEFEKESLVATLTTQVGQKKKLIADYTADRAKLVVKSTEAQVTDHITVRYEISYDGVDIRKLSPGTRGIVLLLLYLALDDSDDRPLIIDQPEENLDPKSVFDELVALFDAAKAKRQVIMVTHNANLVINTDADQIIVALAGPHPSGGLESAEIRKAVCDILEGGEAAFRERARRLRVRLER
jgi:ABC-type lipoprotein export system ATPase subunit